MATIYSRKHMNSNSNGQKRKITVKFTQILTPRIGVRHDVSVAEGNEGVKLNTLWEDFQTFQNKGQQSHICKALLSTK